MLSLRKRSDFLRIKDQGNIIHVNQWLSVAYIKNDSDVSRFGWTISAAVGNAVLRNRFKRWLRETLRVEARTFVTGYDLHFIFRRKNNTYYKDFEREAVDKALKVAQQKLARLS